MSTCTHTDIMIRQLMQTIAYNNRTKRRRLSLPNLSLGLEVAKFVSLKISV